MQVVLATARPYLCDSLCLYLSTCDVDVVGQADTVASLLTLASRLRPDVVLVDTALTGPSLEPTLDALRAADKPPAVVLLSDRDTPDLPEAAARADAQCIIGDPPEALLALLDDLGPAGADTARNIQPSG